MTGAAFHGTAQASHGLSGAGYHIAPASQGCLVHSTRPDSRLRSGQVIARRKLWTTAGMRRLQKLAESLVPSLH